ncbi:MAG TPA: PTS sugar transporter subunit IIA [Candidatus Acidoferrales bacterium]|nr:PTS sugar transporter subunit IIA [Candidatus Acidoferrales bacterium]
MSIAETDPVTTAPLDVVELRHKRRDSALTQLAAAAERIGAVHEPGVLVAALQHSEQLGCSALGRGFAVPHVRSVAVHRPLLLLGRSTRGIEWGAADGQPVHLVAAVLTPSAASARTHVDRVTAVAHAIRLQRTRLRLLEAGATAASALFRELMA